MPENTRLGGNVDQIDVAFVERGATPKLLMKVGIQSYLAGLSLSNTVSVLDTSGVEERDPPYILGFTRPIYGPKL